MKPAFVFLLILVPLLALMSPGQADPSSIAENTAQKALSKLETRHQGHLYCISMKSNGRLSSCPRGFAVTSCACGYGCGSWDVQGDQTCHCQCQVMDWTTARCCRN
ncbi:resistin-like beta [Notamacropus eugenii]|uniref:resistin-like beta n=1 Tax=Notamacropus eugenii TaxID=9315 RepID=UPI003B6858BF